MNYSPYSGRNIGFGIACREAYTSNETMNLARHIVRYDDIHGHHWSKFVEANTAEGASVIARFQDPDVVTIVEVVKSGRQ